MDLDARRQGHVLGDLGLTVARDGDGFASAAPIVPEMWVPGTRELRTSILATWVDLLAGLVAIDRFAPRVPVTLELDVHVLAPLPGTGEVRGASRLVKGGRSVVVARVDLHHEAEGRIAVGAASFTPAPDPRHTLPEGAADPGAISAVAGRLAVPFAERAGCRRTGPGVAELGRSEDALNASDSINGGLLSLAVEEAVLSCTPGGSLASLAMRYLRPVRVGPVVATAEVEHGVGFVEVVDAGDRSRPAVVATTRTFGPDCSVRG